MRMLHTMLRVGDLERSLAFYTGPLGMKLLRRARLPRRALHARVRRLRRRVRDHTVLELTHNWDTAELRDRHRLRPRRARRRRHLRDLRAAARGGREDHARARPDEARHDRDRLRRGPRRLQDRADPGPVRTERGPPEPGRKRRDSDVAQRAEARASVRPVRRFPPARADAAVGGVDPGERLRARDRRGARGRGTRAGTSFSTAASVARRVERAGDDLLAAVLARRIALRAAEHDLAAIADAARDRARAAARSRTRAARRPRPPSCSVSTRTSSSTSAPCRLARSSTRMRRTGPAKRFDDLERVAARAPSRRRRPRAPDRRASRRARRACCASDDLDRAQPADRARRDPRSARRPGRGPRADAARS